MDSGRSDAQKNANDTATMGPDAVPFSLLTPNLTSQGTIQTLSENLWEDDKYNMKHKQRGVALIFNQENFDVDQKLSRLGAKKDGGDLEKTLKYLRFEVRQFMDLTVSQIMQKLDDVSKEDHSDADCIMIAVMTHGKKGGLLYAKDNCYKREEIWERFTADKVPSLAGKPKIFVFQASHHNTACRGVENEKSAWAIYKYDPKEKVEPKSKSDDSAHTNVPVNSCVFIPVHADFITVESSTEGCVSKRHEEDGTVFIQDLCKEMNENATKTEFLQLLNQVSRRVALSRQNESHMQMPEITSRLTRFLYFR